MLEAIVRWSLRYRGLVVILTLVLSAAGVIYGSRLKLDALPDVTGNQVVVLTTAPGFSPEEVERLVTRPLEAALGGLPGALRQRSLSRYGISSISVLFDEDVDPFLARQWVQERISAAANELPQNADPPLLGPYTGGLGEIFHFTLSANNLSREELLALASLRVAPILRSVAGVVEANTWGGAQRTLDVVADPVKLAARGVTLRQVQEALTGGFDNRPAAALPRAAGQVFLRAAARPSSAAELANRVVLVDDPEPGHGPVALRIGDLARIEEGSLPRLGSATANGGGETVYVMVQMLRDANALEVMARVRAKLPEVRASLPNEVRIDVVYDRSSLVLQTLRTVFINLTEGGLLVLVVLFLMLGSFRAGLLVAAAIPLSMLGAVAGMVLLRIPGNLMSLGAIDFGLLVDGAVVMVESFFHHAHEQRSDDLRGLVERTAVKVVRPVFASVLIILVVYVPIVSLTGVDGKMFRPMALTVILALASALLLVVTFVPAAASLFLRRQDVPEKEPWMVRILARAYQPLLGWALQHPVAVALLAAALLSGGLLLFIRAGSAFVPQLDEGDLVIQTTRAPDISLESATRSATKMEAAMRSIPEVKQVVSRIGSPAVATDIMGLEQADVFVELKPKQSWRPGLTKEALVDEIERTLADADPQAERSYTQPIQMRFNELLGGETADVAVAFLGPELSTLRQLAEAAEPILASIPGAEDVRITLPPDSPLVEVRPNALAAAQHGLTIDEIMDAVVALKAGIHLGVTYEGMLAVPIRLRLDFGATAFELERVSLPTPKRQLIPLTQLGDVVEQKTPSLVLRENGERRAVVGFNVRGGSLGDVSEAARSALEGALKLPDGYRTQWGGQYESLQEARARMALVIPASLLLIFGILWFTFRSAGPAMVVLMNVPFAGVGGILALSLRALPISISAAIGFIALSGIAVLNGVVLMAKLLELIAIGTPPLVAARQAAESRLRPVLMTALVAALGFVPMMLAKGVGAEVQAPLATVVVGGLLTSTILTLLILPSLYGAVAHWVRRARS